MKSSVYSRSTLITCFVLAAATCAEKKPAPAPQVNKASPPVAAEQKAAAPATWACPAQPGTPPSGELTAERVAAANTTRTEAGLYEGPVWIGDTLYFSDFTFGEGFPSRVQALRGDGTVTTVIDNSGTNGLAVDNDGALLAATHDRKAIARYDLGTGGREILVGEYNGNPFNSPNDLTLSRQGVLYFTDPAYQRAAAPGGQEKTRVYQFDGKTVTVIDDTLENPNGISLSPDQTILYVAGGTVLRAYPIENGVVGAGKDIAGVTVPDGMAVDCAGNLYVTEHTQQHIRVLSPGGDELAKIKVDANITNAAFGGPERKTLFITGAGAVWKVELGIAGLPY